MNKLFQIKIPKVKFPARISLIYLIVSVLWIAFSDRLVELLFIDPQVLSLVQTFKGWGFVVVTAFLLYMLTRKHILALRNAQQELLKREQQYQQVFEANTQPMWVYSPETLAFVAVNEVAIQHYGYSRVEFLDMTLKDIRPESEIPEMMSDVSTQTDQPKVWKHLTKNGSVIDVEIRASTIDVDGQKLRLVLARDITRIKAIENRLHESEQMHRTLIDSSPDAVIVYTDTTIRFINPAGLRLFNANAEDIVDKSIFEFLNMDKHKDLAQLIQQASHFRDIHANEMRLHLKNGEILDLEISSSRMVFKGEEATQAIIRNVSQRKQVERELQDSEERFRIMSESNIAGIYIIQNNLVQYANPAILDMFGYTEDEVVDTLSPLDFVHPKDKDRIIQTTQQLTGEVNQDRYSFEGIQKNGTSVYIEVFSSATNYRGQPALIGTMIDITERHKAEKALSRSEANMRAIFDNTLQAFVLFDRDKQVQIANRVAQVWAMGVLGEPLEPGDSADELFAEFDLNLFNESFVRSLAGESVNVESQVTVGNQERWFEINYNPVRIGDTVTGVALSVLDVTQRKQSEHTKQVLEKANTSLTESLELDTVLSTILDYAQQLVDHDTSSVILPDDQNKMVFEITRGLGRAYGYEPFEKDQYPEILEIMSTHRSVVIDDIGLLSHWHDDLSQLFRSWLGIPLVAGGTFLGLFAFEKREPNYFTEAHKNLLEALAAYAAVAIKNAQLYQQVEDYASGLETKVQERTEELQKEYKRRAGLATIELAINEQHELQTMMVRTVDIVRDVLDITIGCSIVLWDTKAEKFTISATNVPGQPLQSTARSVRKTGGATKWVIDNAEPIVVTDTAHDPFGANRMIETYGVKAYIGTPLTVNDETIGVLYALDKQSRDYDTDAIDVLQQFATRVAVAINRVQLYTSLQESNDQLQKLSHSLQTHNNRISAILNSSTDGIVLFSLANGIQQVNPAFERIIASPEDLCLHQPLHNFIVSEDHHIFDSVLATVLETPVDGIELHMQSSDRSQFDAELSIARARNITSDDIQMVCVVRDITERKQSELELQNRERWYRALASHIPHTTVMLFDRDYRFQIVEGSEPYFPREAAEGKTVQEFLDPEVYEALFPTYEATLNGEYARQERHRSDRIFDGHFVPILDNNDEVVIGGLVVIRDVTDERKQERIIQENEERLRILFENLPDGIILISQQGDVHSINSGGLDILGVSRKQILHKNVFEILPHFDFDLAKAQANFQRTTSGESVTSEYAIKRMNGQPITVKLETHSVTIQDDPYLLSILRDISQQKQAEEAMASALEKERELNELKSRFVSMASHEFRTPLASILAVVETLDAYRHKLSDEQFTKRFQKIRGHIAFLTEIMEDMLLLARMQERRLSFNPVLLNLDAVVQSVLEEFEIQSVPSPRLTYTYDDQLSEIYLDKKLIRQIITNLISNAIKYSPSEEQISLQIEKEENTVVIRVQDKGIGIPKEDLKHLFEPFHRANNVGNISGTGLGLVITKEAVEAHSGTITVESSVDSGTTFIVMLPVKERGK